MTPAEISAYLAHHRDWAAYTLVCAAEMRVSALRARMTPFGSPEFRAAEVARYEARITERVAEHEHHLRMALEYREIQDSAGVAREVGAGLESPPTPEPPASPPPPFGGAGGEGLSLRDCDDCRSVAPCSTHGRPSPWLSATRNP